jgi:2-polyprenyl-3-methyl-5-hydroxy-6-metoxy-1,4-benzoquinol methylase
MNLNEDRLNAVLGRAVLDMGAVMHAALVLIGEKHGLYKLLDERGPITSAELASGSNTKERYVREWLASQVAGGYVTYDKETDRYSLTPEQAFTLAEEDSPAYLPGAFELALSAAKAEPKIAERFQSGEGLGWHEHDPGLFRGTERFFRPGYAAYLTGTWIPSLHGVEAKLKKGARVADIGCGHGSSTILMAEAYPNSKFDGFDYHRASIQVAEQRAREADVENRVSFRVGTAQDFPGENYDLIACFDSLHDMGDPVGAAKHILSKLGKDGTWMIVEPFANDTLEENSNPVGRLFYSASAMICTPASMSQDIGLALGAQAGEKRINDVVIKGGFTRFKRASETPFNIVYEAKP